MQQIGKFIIIIGIILIIIGIVIYFFNSKFSWFGNLPGDIKNTLRNARKYMEGRGLSVELRRSEDAEIVKKLIRIKVEN